MFHSTLRCKSGAAAGASNTLLRAYVHAVGANCDDQEVRRDAFEAAQRLAEAEKELQQASAPAGAGAALAGAPRPSTNPPRRDSAAGSPAAAAAFELESDRAAAGGGTWAQPSSGSASVSLAAASRGGGGCASGDVGLRGERPGSGSGFGCEAPADTGCASSPEVWRRASNSRVGLAVAAAAAVSSSAGTGKGDAGGSSGPYTLPMTGQPDVGGCTAVPPPGSAAAAAQAVKVRPAWDCLAPPPPARYRQGVWTWSHDHHFQCPPGADTATDLEEALCAPSSACWGTATELDALTLATSLPMNVGTGAAAASAASALQSRVLAAARAASTGTAQAVGDLQEGAWVAGAAQAVGDLQEGAWVAGAAQAVGNLQEGAWVAGAARDPLAGAQPGSAWPQELGLEAPPGCGWRGPAGGGGALAIGCSERGGGAQRDDLGDSPDDVMDHLYGMTSDAGVSAPAAMELSTAAPSGGGAIGGGGSGGFRSWSAGQGPLRGAQLSGGAHLLPSGGWPRGGPERGAIRAQSTASDGSGVGALFGCGPTGPDGGRPPTPAALAAERLLQSALPQASGGINGGNYSGGGGGVSGSSGAHGWHSLPTGGLPWQPAAAAAFASFSTWHQAGQLPLSAPSDLAMGPPRLPAVTVTGRASHAAYLHAASAPALDLSHPVSVSPVDPLTLCASTLSAPAFPAAATYGAAPAGFSACSVTSGGAAGFGSDANVNPAGGGNAVHQGFGAGGGPRLQPSEGVLNLAPALALAAAYAQPTPCLAAAFAAGFQAGAIAGVAGTTAASSVRSLPLYGAMPLLELEAAGMGAASGAFLSAPEGATNFRPATFPAPQSPPLLLSAHTRVQRPSPAPPPYAPPPEDSWAVCQAVGRLAGAALEPLPPLLPPPLPPVQLPPTADWEPPSLEVLMTDWLPSVGTKGADETV